MASNNKILTDTGTNELEIVEFTIERSDKSGNQVDQSFAINVAKIREIIVMPELTRMPNLPKSVYGIFNLRNRIIPALDLGNYLYGTQGELKDKKMIIAEFNKVQVGFIVHDVKSIHRISWTDITSPDNIEEFDQENFSIVGILQFKDKNILMVDVEKIVADIDPDSAIEYSQPKKLFKDQPIAVTAEDSSTIRKMISERLENAGFKVISFNDGAAAWEYMEGLSVKVQDGAELEELVNIVITDIEMPNMDGYTLTKKIKTNDYLKKTPVVIFSSIINSDILHKGESVGADAQMSKPQIGELLGIIRGILDEEHAEA